MWAVLSDPAKKGGKWDVREFMANGEREIALLNHQLDQLGLACGRGTALDFGCGVGRLAQALARRFDHVIGVDISPSMIATANQLNRYPGIASYICNQQPDLRVLPSHSCDFIYSNIVLQHIEPELSVRYLEEFFRLLKPGGVLVFQLPSHREPPARVEIRPMHDAAYRARVELTAPVPAGLNAHELVVTVRVTNTSPHEWRQRDCGSLRVGNHWLDHSGRFMVVQDDGRATLPQVMMPGESCEVALPVTAPPPGSYQGEVDVVHEGVTWFGDKGSLTARFDVSVGALESNASRTSVSVIREFEVPDYPAMNLAGRPGVAAETETAPFPMHGVHRSEVQALIDRHDASIVHVEDGLRAGVEWVDYRYFVRGADALTTQP